MITIERTVEISKPIQIETLRGNEFTGEQLAHTFKIHVSRDGVAVPLTGTVTARFFQANGASLLLAETCGLEDGAATVQLVKACYDIPGRFALAIYHTDNGEVTCIYSAVGAVVNVIGDPEYDPGNVIGDISTLIDTANQASEDAQEALAQASAVVSYSAQAGKTDAEKAQARTNIGAASEADIETAMAEHFPATGKMQAGVGTSAAANGAVATGVGTTASGQASHAEGQLTTADGQVAHAEGYGTFASGDYSHAEGFGTKASGDHQHAFGKYNVEDANDTYLEIAGNGTGDEARSNARTLDWNGNEALAGDLTVHKGEAGEMAVGAEISSLKSALDDVASLAYSDNNIQPLWEVGGIGSNGENVTRATSIRTKNRIPISDYYSIVTTSAYVSGYLSVYADLSGNMLHRYSITGGKEYTIKALLESYPTTLYFRIEIAQCGGDVSAYNRIQLILSHAYGYAENQISGSKNAYIMGHIDNGLYKDASMWEIGAVQITQWGWNYVSGYTSRIRLKKGNFIYLRKGDKVKLTDYTDAKFYIGYRYNGEYYIRQNWVTSGEYTIPHDGEWNLGIARLSDSTTVSSVSDLLDLLVITRTNIADTAISSAFPPSAFHNKGISASQGTKADNSKRLCTIRYFNPDGMPATFLAKDGYSIYVCAYTKAGVYQGYAKPDGTFTKVSGEVVTMTQYSISAADAALYKYYIILNRDDNGDISASESNNLCISVSNLADVMSGISAGGPIYINVKDFDAVGNGTTDDAFAIQSAFDVCNTAGGGTVYFPAGTYRVDTQIIFYSNMRIIMSEGATILRGAEKNGVFFSHCTDSTLAYNGVHDVIFEGGTIDLGTGITQGGVAIGVIHGQNITIRNVTTKHVNSGYHSFDICCCKSVLIEDCIITDLLTNSEWAECIQIDAADQRASFPSPELSEGAATFDSTPTINVNISGCRFDLNSYSPAVGNHNDIASKRIFFHDNVIVGTGGSRGAVAFEHYSTYYPNPNATTEVLIHHNIFDGCTYGFNFDAGATGHFYIRDNIFKDIGTLMVHPTATAGEFLNNIEL